MGAQEATSRALALASTPYQQSGTRVDILAPRACVVTETAPGYEFCHTHKARASWGVCDGRFEAWA